MSLEFEYRELAAACLDLVKRAAAPADKTRLLAIAEAWLELADCVRSKAGNAKPRNGDRTDTPAERASPTAPLPSGDFRNPAVVRHRTANSVFAAPNGALCAVRFDFPRREF